MKSSFFVLTPDLAYRALADGSRVGLTVLRSQRNDRLDTVTVRYLSIQRSLSNLSEKNLGIHDQCVEGMPMRKTIATLLFAMYAGYPNPEINAGGGMPLAERLGFKSGDKILIINGDDVGVSHAANAATIDALENGLMTSATIMVPCPWFPEIAAYARAHPNADFGLHLTHTAEWKGIKWGPVASRNEVPGLVDPQGYLWPDTSTVYQHATPEQAYIEARAQIQKALAAGIDVTHLDSHMGVLQYNDAYFQVYRRLAKEFDLPLRMGSQETLAPLGGGHQRVQLEEDGTL
jgi:hypothetical protein